MEDTLCGCVQKGPLLEIFAAQSFNERQQLIINKLLDGFEGKLTSSKWLNWLSVRKTQRCVTFRILWNAAS